ncbi:hypothetical protein [Curvivirga aplysinae]|uniref:hypothetical protein n=1 Tax=Curvivirga aplysinae TaxID=2529852 RepID=UPI0012BCB4EC|nr:hypothetical protein [Curvivirga aplysinae]MTI09490.1 hypothetical protein [Curvivirga aplysinae]
MMEKEKTSYLKSILATLCVNWWRILIVSSIPMAGSTFVVPNLSTSDLWFSIYTIAISIYLYIASYILVFGLNARLFTRPVLSKIILYFCFVATFFVVCVGDLKVELAEYLWDKKVHLMWWLSVWVFFEMWFLGVLLIPSTLLLRAEPIEFSSFKFFNYFKYTQVSIVLFLLSVFLGMGLGYLIEFIFVENAIFYFSVSFSFQASLIAVMQVTLVVLLVAEANDRRCSGV